MNRKIFAVLAILMLAGTLTLAVTAEDNLSSILLKPFIAKVDADSYKGVSKTIKNTDISGTLAVKKVNSIDAESIIPDNEFNNVVIGIWGFGTNPVSKGYGKFHHVRSSNIINGELRDNNNNIFAYVKIEIEPNKYRSQQIPFKGALYLTKNDGTTYSVTVIGSLSFMKDTILAFWSVATATDQMLSAYKELVTNGWFYGHVVTDADYYSRIDNDVTDTSSLTRILKGIWGSLNNPVPRGELRATYSSNVIKGELIDKSGNIIAKVKLTVLPTTHLTQKEIEFKGEIDFVDESEVANKQYVRGSFGITDGKIVAFWDFISPTAVSLKSTASSIAINGWFFGEVN